MKTELEVGQRIDIFEAVTDGGYGNRYVQLNRWYGGYIERLGFRIAGEYNDGTGVYMSVIMGDCIKVGTMVIKHIKQP